MKIRILTIGKLKEKYWKDAIAEYTKRLKPYTKFEIIEGAEEDAPEGLTEKEIGLHLQKEGVFFLDKMKPDDYSICLDLDGKLLSSVEMARAVEAHGMMEGKTVNFLIGGSFGIAPEVKNKCDLRLCFGKATFPHQLMRVILTEQIYRSMKIIRKEPYHK